MTPAVGFFYAGLAGEESAANTILMSFITQAIVSLQWFLFGYSFAFGPGSNGFGSFQWGALNDVGFAPSGAYGYNIPHVLCELFSFANCKLKRSRILKTTTPQQIVFSRSCSPKSPPRSFPAPSLAA